MTESLTAVAARVPGQELAGLPELAVEGLREGDARILLDSALTGPLEAPMKTKVNSCRVVSRCRRQRGKIIFLRPPVIGSTFPFRHSTRNPR